MIAGLEFPDNLRFVAFLIAPILKSTGKSSLVRIGGEGWYFIFFLFTLADLVYIHCKTISNRLIKDVIANVLSGLLGGCGGWTKTFELLTIQQICGPPGEPMTPKKRLLQAARMRLLSFLGHLDRTERPWFPWSRETLTSHSQEKPYLLIAKRDLNFSESKETLT